MVPQDLEQFVDHVLDQKTGMDQVDPDVRKHLKADFVASLQNQINASIIAELSPEQLEAFEKILDKADEGSMAAFYNQYVPNLADLVAEVLIRFKTDYVGA